MNRMMSVTALAGLSIALSLALPGPAAATHAGRTYSCVVTVGTAVPGVRAGSDPWGNSDSGVAIGYCSILVQTGGYVQFVQNPSGCVWFWLNSSVTIGVNDYVGPGNELEAWCSLGNVLATNSITIV